jgi:hypothetical protein
LARGTGETAAKTVIVIAMINARFFMAFSLSCLNMERQTEPIDFNAPPV